MNWYANPTDARRAKPEFLIGDRVYHVHRKKYYVVQTTNGDADSTDEITSMPFGGARRTLSEIHGPVLMPDGIAVWTRKVGLVTTGVGSLSGRYIAAFESLCRLEVPAARPPAGTYVDY